LGKFADLDKPLILRPDNRVIEVFLRYANLRPDPTFYKSGEGKQRVWEIHPPDKRNAD
jgi:hypothetical protein